MSFLDELKAQKGLGKKVSPPKVEIKAIETEVKKSQEPPPKKVAEKKEIPEYKSKNTGVTREKWLDEAFEMINNQWFIPKSDVVVPWCRLSIGFPANSRPSATTGKMTLGQYHPAGNTSDGVPQIFISPSKHASSDPTEMLGILVHEMVHAASPGHGHSGKFTEIAKKIGLKGPMTQALPGPELHKYLEKIAENLGNFPHGTIDLKGIKKQKGRLKAFVCKQCGMKIYTTQVWIDKSHGCLRCPSLDCTGSATMEPQEPKS
jgi:hypothetical protein